MPAGGRAGRGPPENVVAMSSADEGPFEYLTCLPGPVALFISQGRLIAADLRRLRAHLVFRRLAAELVHGCVASQGLLQPAIVRRSATDVALIVGAEGVQLGERGLPVGEVRSLVGPGCLIGRSVHDVRGALAAAQDGADYVVAGHIFATGSKPGIPGRGLEWLRSITEAAPVPTIAIGGITEGNVEAVLAAGAYGVATSSILAASDAGERLARMLARIECVKGERCDDHE